jgi:1-acyl-sn-glycerol-3-phosphate acyltransferase
LADWTLRLFVVRLVAERVANGPNFAWHLITALFITPFIVLAPFNGAISNCLPRRKVIALAAGFCALAPLGFLLVRDAALADWRGWCVLLGLVALGAAVYSPARYALLPAAAQDAHLPLTRVNGWIELGGAAAIIGGMVLGLELGERYRQAESEESRAATEAAAVLALAAGLNLLAALTALPVRFPSDVHRPEAPLRAAVGFFRDCGRVFRDRAARGALLGLAGFLGMITAGSGALVAYVLGKEAEDNRRGLIQALLYVTAGAVLGCGLAGLQGHPRRSLGIVPAAATGLLIVLAWAAARGDLHWLPCLLLGVMGGLANVPLRAAYQAAVPADARGNGMAVMNTAIYLTTALLAVLLAALAWPPQAQLGLLAALAAAGALLSWYILFIPWFELLAEIVFWPFWRIRACGPGLDHFPRRGPLLVVANHTAMADPLWLIKVLPRHLAPMMTSTYYDRPGIHWLMKHVAGAIRVPFATFRREAPELDEAVAVLDRGGCVLLFPEGWLKRDEKHLLRYFGQGVWHILRRRPATPVVACWIEGGWGSFTSYKNGPPFTNKPLDWRRRIAIGVREPEVLPPAVLEDHRATRSHLMAACLEARALLELPPAETTAEEPPREAEPDEAAEERR